MDEGVFNNKYFIGIAAALGSMLLTILTQQVLNRRGRLRYFVWHNRIGVSADDAIFGSVRVTWNGTVVANLYSSIIELVNESMKDFENVIVRVFTNDTVLLTERTEIVGTTQILRWANEFSDRLRVAPGQQPTPEQLGLYGGQRDYVIPTMNRGQVVRFTFLNAPRTERSPTIWLDVLHRGLKLEFRVAHNQILGVPQPTAALVGCIIAVLVIGIIIYSIHSVWLAATVAMIYGLFAQIPGAIAVKTWRRLQYFFGG